MWAILAGYSLWIKIAAATETTKTEVRCQTFYGTALPYDVATHTTTVITASPDVTVGFTTTPTSTVIDRMIRTFNKTETLVSTKVITVTESLTADTWTTTSTRLILRPRFTNITTTYTTHTISYEPYSVTLQVPSPDGFVPVNTTTISAEPSASSMSVSDPAAAPTVTSLPDATSSDAHAGPAQVTSIPTASPVEQTIYVWQDGRLTPVPMAAVSELIATPAETVATRPALITDASTSSGGSTDRPVFGAEPGRWSDGDSVAEGPENSPGDSPVQHLISAIGGGSDDGPTATSSNVDAGEATSTSTVVSTDALQSAAAAIDEEYKEEDIPEEPDTTTGSTERVIPTGTIITLTDIPKKTLVPIDFKTINPGNQDEISRRDSSRPPKVIRGLRGALINDPVHSAPHYATLVACTKSIVRERTIWRAYTAEPTFVPQTTKTHAVTTVSILTLTTTVPDKPALKTASFISDLIISTTTTHEHIETFTNTHTYTSTVTRTAHEACQTNNIYGPIGANESHIINVYNRGIDKFTLYDVGTGGDAEWCCIECHTMDRPCLGTVFVDGRCLLLTDNGSQCPGQGSGAGFFVARTSEERPHRRRRWPDFVISNGPCGFFYDGGIGW